jgi:hypothetical protein
VTALAGVATLAVWALRCLPELGPMPEGGAFNSDSAIPVLMANQVQAGPYDWLFWGQDRFGAWPFLLARLLAAPFAAPWTPHTLHVAQALFFCSAVVPWLALAPRGRGLSVAAFLLLPVLSPVLRRTLVDLGHVDIWQLGALLWTWWALRRAAGPPPSGRALWAASLGGALATWSSLVSAPLLLALGLLESGRARSSLRGRAVLCLPVVVGVCLETTVRMAWHSAVRARHWHDVRTRASFDVGHLGENVTGLAASAVAAGTWPWFLGVLVAGLLAVAFLRGRLGARDGRPSALGSVAWTVVGSALCTWLCLALLVATRHVRENGWAPRYFGIPLVFAILGVGAALGAGLEALLVRRWPRATGPALAVAALVAVVLGLPRSAPDPRAQVLQPMAEGLARRFPGAVLLDGYWRTYALAAFVPPGLLVPIPAEGEWNRHPDWVALLQPDRPILVGTTGPLVLAANASPPAERVQYGIHLALVRPNVAVLPEQPGEAPEDRLSLYRVVPGAGDAVPRALTP